MSMFCYQCEQTARGIGCTTRGVCGKDETTAALLDLLVAITKEISSAAEQAASNGVHDEKIDDFVLRALFATVTNVDFDPERIAALIHESADIRRRARCLIQMDQAGKEALGCEVDLSSAEEPSIETLVEAGRAHSIERRRDRLGATAVGLQELILYGLKGAASYAHHAFLLGKKDPKLFADFHRSLAFLATESTEVALLLDEALRVGKINYRAMELLDEAHTETFGNPEPTSVRITPIEGKAILVSGHDLKDLETLLEQTEGRDIHVYTHGEMLPGLAYPGLKKYPHLAGNYGGAWQDQRREFDEFPGAILMTTNCIQEPKDSYQDRIFTTGLVAWPGVRHIGEGKDFTPVIEAALAEEGFAAALPERRIMIGFAADAVLSVADKVVEAVRAGKIRHFFLIGGCDGAKSGRNYFTELALQVPDDCVILTLACGKYRFNKMEFGEIDGIPRLLDVGQCNDAYSAIRIVQALAEAFRCGVNELPLSLVLSWFEQKAVAILLTLLSLGIKGMRVGPSLPAFFTEDLLEVLADQFNLTPISDPEHDIRAMLGKKWAAKVPY